MSYIGRGTDKISNIEILDNITFDGSSSYSITKSSVAFVPNSAQSLLISIDGVVQATNFTISGSTIDFGVAVPSTSTCDFFLHYGTGVLFTPADGTVTTAKIGSNAVTTAKIADANVTSAKMFSGFANGITMADQWRLTADITTDTDPISANLERVDDTGFNYIGTGMSVSSGTWSFPETGLYYIHHSGMMSASGSNDNVFMKIKTTVDNSTYNDVSVVGASAPSGNLQNRIVSEIFFNVTNTTTHKLQFNVSSIAAGSLLRGNTGFNETSFTFIRLGDSQ